MSPTACARGVDQPERDILLRPSIYGISALRPIYIHRGQRGMREQPSRIIVSGSANGVLINSPDSFFPSRSWPQPMKRRTRRRPRGSRGQLARDKRRDYGRERLSVAPFTRSTM